MTDKEKLKPCPFCAGEPELCRNFDRPNMPMHWICCKSCHACPGDYATEAEAITAWNTRAPDSAPEGEGLVGECYDLIAGGTSTSDAEIADWFRLNQTTILTALRASDRDSVIDALDETQATLSAIRAQIHNPDCADHIHELAGKQMQQNADALKGSQA